MPPRKPARALSSRPSPQALQLAAMLPRLAQVYVRWVRTRLQEQVNLEGSSGLTLPRLTMLGVLAGQGERLLMGELGEKLELQPRSVTVLTDGLEKEGLVRRVRHETDRRAIWVEITPAGSAVAKRIIKPHRAAAAEIFDDLPQSDRDELLRTMRLLLDALERRGDSGSDSGNN